MNLSTFESEMHLRERERERKFENGEPLTRFALASSDKNWNGFGISNRPHGFAAPKCAM